MNIQKFLNREIPINKFNVLNVGTINIFNDINAEAFIKSIKILEQKQNNILKVNIKYFISEIIDLDLYCSSEELKSYLINLSESNKELNEFANKYPQIFEFWYDISKIGVTKLLNFLINDLNLNYHPDDKLEDYMDDKLTVITNNGNKLFLSNEILEKIDNFMEYYLNKFGDFVYQEGFNILSKKNNLPTYKKFIDSDFEKYLANISGYYSAILNEWLENKEIYDNLFEEKYPFDFSFDELGIVEWVESLTNLEPSQIFTDNMLELVIDIKQNFINLQEKIENIDDEYADDFWNYFYNDYYPFLNADNSEKTWEPIYEKIIIWLDNIEEKINNGYFLNHFINSNIEAKINDTEETFNDWVLKLIKFVKDNSWFAVETKDESKNLISFFTRKNGNVGDETPGKADIKEANRLANLIKNNFDVTTEIETVDEWVNLNIYRNVINVDLTKPKIPTYLNSEPKYLLTIGDNFEFIDSDISFVQGEYFEALEKYEESGENPKFEPIIWKHITAYFGIAKTDEILLTVGDKVIGKNSCGNFIDNRTYEKELLNYDGRPSTEARIWKINN